MGMQVRCNYVVGVYENPTSTSHDKTFAPEESCSLYDSADKPTKNRCILCKNYGRNLIINLNFTHAIFNHFWSFQTSHLVTQQTWTGHCSRSIIHWLVENIQAALRTEQNRSTPSENTVAGFAW